MTAFGVVSIGTAFVKSFAGLVVTRVFLGLAEGGTLVRQYPDLRSLIFICTAVGLDLYLVKSEYSGLLLVCPNHLKKSTKYYRRSELVWRLGIFFGLSTDLAGACGLSFSEPLLLSEYRCQSVDYLRRGFSLYKI